MLVEGPIVVVHGGVDMDDDEPSLAALREAADAAWRVLDDLGDARDAAVAAVAVLEDDPAFNAGYGSVLTRAGTVETDGAVADGNGAFAGVGAAPGLRHPAAVARHLLDEGDTALLVGPGASAFAASVGLPSEDLVTEEQRLALTDEPGEGRKSEFTGRRVPSETVGCIVVTAGGRIAAASSTGGLLGKRPGRVGDAALVGAGIWADERHGVLCSGSGEAAIRATLAFRVAERAGTCELPLALAWGVKEATSHGGAITAVVAVDAAGRRVAAAHSGASFPVVARDGAGTWVVPAEVVA
jgi:beta-aspartyl-peptidase (threonine type)